MKTKVIQYSILLVLFLGLTLSGFSFDEDSEISIGLKRGMKIRKTKDKNLIRLKKKKVFSKLNTTKSFEKVKKQNAFVFMIGNDNYKKKSGFSKLGQCYNDVKLLKQIFIKCVKIDENNVYPNKDLTLKEFKRRFKQFIRKLDKESMVIITYSGHGNDDGSLVFTKGGMLRPQELKRLINSYKNDTVLMIDACYSGNNEGPKDAFSKKEVFKSNSVRIYASLAHLTAKEIKYNNKFFRPIKQFYRDVLKLDDLEGNGYFTAMIGVFFAEYRFKKDENISFKDLISYITNKGKQYVEYLAVNQSTNKRLEAAARLNQQPKILPIKEKVIFFDENHNYIFIQKYIRPFGLEPGVTGGLFFPMGNMGALYNSPGLMVTLYLNYELDFLLKDLFANINFTFMSLSSGTTSNTREIGLSILVPSVGIKYHAFRKSFFSFSLGADSGLAFTFRNLGSFGSIKEESSTFTNLYFGGNVSLYFELFKNFNIVIPARFVYIGYNQEPLYGVSLELGVSYYF